MKQHLSGVTLLVRDYDEAIAFYTDKLGFRLVEDTRLNQTKRWVTLIPPGATETRLLLAAADGTAQEACIGNQTGGRVFLFLTTDNFHRDYRRMLSHGVTFLEAPRIEPYGTVAVFVDLYGNKWDLIAPNR